MRSDCNKLQMICFTLTRARCVRLDASLGQKTATLAPSDKLQHEKRQQLAINPLLCTARFQSPNRLWTFQATSSTKVLTERVIYKRFCDLQKPLCLHWQKHFLNSVTKTAPNFNWESHSDMKKFAIIRWKINVEKLRCDVMPPGFYPEALANAKIISRADVDASAGNYNNLWCLECQETFEPPFGIWKLWTKNKIWLRMHDLACLMT